MKLPNTLIAFLVAMTTALPAYSVESKVARDVDSPVMKYAFQNTDSTAITILSDSEMADIQGDLIPLALTPAVISALKAAGWGAFGGAAGSAIVEAADNPNANPSSVAAAAGKGAVGGALLGIGSANAVPVMFRTIGVGLGLSWISANAFGRGLVTITECSGGPTLPPC